MITTTKTEKTLFQHIVKKVEDEKAELLNSINQEISENWNKCDENPTVYVIYKIKSEELCVKYYDEYDIGELNFVATDDVLALTVPVNDDYKSLTMKQFDELIDNQFSKINKVLLNSESVIISDDFALDDFKSLKTSSQYVDLANILCDIGDSLMFYRISVFDINSKAAAIALIFWVENHFCTLDNKEKSLATILEQFKILALTAFNEWSLEFIRNFQSIVNGEFSTLKRIADPYDINQMYDIEELFSNVISIKEVQTAIETERRVD